MLNCMPAKGLRQQAFAPRSGSFLDCEADKKARHCEGCPRRNAPLEAVRFYPALDGGADRAYHNRAEIKTRPGR